MSKESDVVDLIADGIIELADGDYRKAQIIAAACLIDDVRSTCYHDKPSNGRCCFVSCPNYSGHVHGYRDGDDIPRFGATDYAEDWR